MQAYVKFAIKAFRKDFVYKADYIFGILNTLVMIFVYVAIWKIIYNGQTVIEGVTFNEVVTNFILGLTVSQAFILDDFMVASKIFDGTISFDILRPVNFMGYLFSYNLGGVLFRILMQVFPAMFISIIIFGILPPVSIGNFMISIISVALGLVIMFLISYIISLIAFWFQNVWSIATIKNVLISTLAGIYVPIWCLPEPIQKIVSFTPFDSLYHAPISIYLGNFDFKVTCIAFLKQAVWIIILYIISSLMWKNAVKKLVHQGG